MTESRDSRSWRSAAALIVGNEILAGRVSDENIPYLARELRGIGVELREVRVVPDEEQAIAAAVVAMRADHDVVFTSGGVGPTHDDVTLAGVARAFEVPLVRDPEMVALIRTWYGDEASAAAYRMADLPQGAELRRHERSRVPIVQVDNVVILPGLPSLFRKKVTTVCEWIGAGEAFHLRQVLTRLDEGAIATALEEVSRRHPDVALGSYPEPDALEHDVKLTLESRSSAAVAAALDDLLARLPAEAIVRVE